MKVVEEGNLAEDHLRFSNGGDLLQGNMGDLHWSNLFKSDCSHSQLFADRLPHTIDLDT